MTVALHITDLMVDPDQGVHRMVIEQIHPMVLHLRNWIDLSSKDIASSTETGQGAHPDTVASMTSLILEFSSNVLQKTGVGPMTHVAKSCRAV